MVKISIQVNESLLNHYGLEALQAKLQKIIQLEELHLEGQKIQDALSESELDHDQLWEDARAAAWEDYKNIFLKDILP
ncbi:MAG: hypothetical protein NW226_23045 [Microscillaceae bacterium]|nr:hypothetical protein [Microscillaceae bacterium]